MLLKTLIDVFHKSDIFSIFNKLREVDIALYLLLNENQRHLVSYIQKEQIVFNEKTEKINYYAKYKNNFSQEKKVEVLANFIDQGKRGELTNEIDQKIFDCLDTNLL